MKMMFVLLPLIYIGGNIYLFRHMLHAVSVLPLWLKVVLSVLFWTAAFSLFISTGLRDSSIPDTVSRAMFMTGSVWMVFLLYMVIGLIICDLIHLAIPSFHGGFRYSLVIVTAILIYGNINYRHPKTEHVEISFGKRFGKERMRIVAVSDVHIGHGTGVKALSRYVELINEQSPDIVLIAGDLIDNSIAPLLKHPFDKELERISAPVYMVPGNHEYISGIDACTEYLSKTDITLLRDSIATLPEGIRIIGRDDRSNKDRKSLEALVESAGPEMPIIVIDHQPYDLAHADSLGIDLQISGHTHAGQIWPLTVIIDRMYEQGHGYRKWNHAHIYVSSGLSLWGPPFRIGTRSDLAVIDITSD